MRCSPPSWSFPAILLGFDKEALVTGDYVSYMSPTSKDTRRVDWKSLGFAGSVDWAVDLQSFTADDVEIPPIRPSGEGCISGDDDTVNSGDLCGFCCGYGFCPESLCTCVSTGPIKTLPAETSEKDATAWDELDLDLNRLCKFACRYGYCPDDICTTPSANSDEIDASDIDEPSEQDSDEIDALDYDKLRDQNSKQCRITRTPNGGADVHEEQCIDVCKAQVDQAKSEDRMTSYGCIGHFPLDKEIPWQNIGSEWMTVGKCVCDHETVNWFGDLWMTVLAGIGQVCLLVCSGQEEYIVDQIRPAAISSCQP